MDIAHDKVEKSMVKAENIKNMLQVMPLHLIVCLTYYNLIDIKSCFPLFFYLKKCINS